MFRRALMPILLGVLVLGSSLSGAQAYRTTGMHYDHIAITYSCGDSTLAEAVAMWAAVSALEDGGCTDDEPDIVLIFPDPWDYDPNAIGWTAYTDTTDYVIHQSTIAIRQDAIGFIGVYLHEVGHALGSSHSDVQDAAMSPYCCSWLHADDIAMIQSIYGPPEPAPLRPVFLPGLAVD